ncbi:MAG TPA: hypothetical protein PKA82_05200 [Pyrinomonadaceae bacterium]|nr:hypothetical protein [Pyrinomonadaceae bacterium]
MKRINLMLSIAVLAFFAVAASAQQTGKDSAVVAKWNVVFAAPGQDVSGTITIEKVGDVFKGNAVTEYGDAPMSDVKVAGDTFSGKIVVNAQGQAFSGTISGGVKDGKLAGELVLEGLGNIPYSGSKP